MKLIAGKMNVLLTKCPVGYADGANKPKRIKQPKALAQVIKVRRQERLIV